MTRLMKRLLIECACHGPHGSQTAPVWYMPVTSHIPVMVISTKSCIDYVAKSCLATIIIVTAHIQMTECHISEGGCGSSDRDSAPHIGQYLLIQFQ